MTSHEPDLERIGDKLPGEHFEYEAVTIDKERQLVGLSDYARRTLFVAHHRLFSLVRSFTGEDKHNFPQVFLVSVSRDEDEALISANLQHREAEPASLTLKERPDIKTAKLPKGLIPLAGISVTSYDMDMLPAEMRGEHLDKIAEEPDKYIADMEDRPAFLAMQSLAGQLPRMALRNRPVPLVSSRVEP